MGIRAICLRKKFNTSKAELFLNSSKNSSYIVTNKCINIVYKKRRDLCFLNFVRYSFIYDKLPTNIYTIW